MALAKFNSKRSNEAGFSLIETMVATLLLATGLVATAQMIGLATRGNIAAQRSTYTATLAQEKMEQLRGLAWGFDAIGLPMQDFTSDISVEPAATNGGPGLQPSPTNALSANTPGTWTMSTVRATPWVAEPCRRSTQCTCDGGPSNPYRPIPTTPSSSR